MSSAGRQPSFQKEDVKSAGIGRVVEVLHNVAGIPLEHLDGKHHPCPKCGGKDRFRLIDPDAGAVFCNQCFNRDNGDFLAAIMHYRGCVLPEALGLAGDYLRVQPVEGKEAAAAHVPHTTAESDKGRPEIDDICNPEATYSYTDEKGVTLYQVLRYRCTYADGTKGKTFMQRRPNPDYKKGGREKRWVWGNIKAVRQVLYEFRRVLKSPTVFIVEGEKDADRLNRLFVQAGIRTAIATTSARGAKNVAAWPGFVKECSLDQKKIPNLFVF